MQSIFGPALQAEAARIFIESTLAHARAAHRANLQRDAAGGMVPAEHREVVSLQSMELPQGELPSVEDESLPAGLLSAIGFEPVIINKADTPEQARTAYTADVARLQQEKSQQSSGE